MDVRTCISVFVLLLAAVNAESPHPWKPRPCCLPKQFEAYLGLFEGVVPGKPAPGTPIMAEGILRISFDSKNKKGAYSGTIYVDPPPMHIYQRAVIDYDKQLLYYITEEGKKCVKVPFPSGFTGNCIPDSAKFLGSFYYGYGRSKIQAKAYRLQFSAPGTFYNITLTVTDKECYPIGETIVGSTVGGDVMLTEGFVNMTLGIKDPSVFDLPPSCRNITMASKGTMLPRHIYFL